MDLMARKRLREKKRKEEEMKKLLEQEVFRKKDKAYAPSSKKLTVITFFAFLIVGAYLFFNSEIVLQEECGLIPGIECRNLELKHNSIIFEVHNFMKEEMNITLQITGCEETIENVIRPNEMAAYHFNCSVPEKNVKRKIFITYVGYSELPHHKEGYVQGRIE